MNRLFEDKRNQVIQRIVAIGRLFLRDLRPAMTRLVAF
jgi:hypothetical protein